MALIGRTVNLRGAKAINGSEGKNLLSALTAFVKVVINSPLEGHSEQGKTLKISKIFRSKDLTCGSSLADSPKPGVAVDEDRMINAPQDLPKRESDTTRLHLNL